MGYLPFPDGGYYWVSQQPAGPPRSVVNAVRFMYAGACLQILNAVLTAASIGNATTIIMRTQPADTVGQAHSAAVQQIVFLVAGSLTGAAIWLWMARKNAAGRRWARTVASFLFAIDTIATPLALIATGLGGSVFGVAGWVVGLCAIVCLWRGESSRYIAESRYR